MMKAKKLIKIDGEITLVCKSITGALYTVNETRLILFTPKRQSESTDVDWNIDIVAEIIDHYNSNSTHLKIEI